VAIGFAIYFAFLTFGGVLQGLAMLDPARPFMDSVEVLTPYLMARTFGGTLMIAGHVVFAYHFFAMALNLGPQRSGSVLLGNVRPAEA
jgi:cytochrome c oxidase cbb3-type subunit 1